MSHPGFVYIGVDFTAPAARCSLQAYMVMVRWITWAYEVGSPYCAPIPMLAPKRNVVFVNIMEGT